MNLEAAGPVDTSEISNLADSLMDELNSLRERERRQNLAYERMFAGLNKRIDSLNRVQEEMGVELAISRQIIDSIGRMQEETGNELERSMFGLIQNMEKTKKGNATLFLAVFSLLALLFVYFFFQNYKFERIINKKILRIRIETDEKIDRQGKKWKKNYLKVEKGLKLIKKNNHKRKKR